MSHIGVGPCIRVNDKCGQLLWSCAGVDLKQVRQQEAEGRLAAEDLRLLIGESTWLPTQLEAELSTGCWLVVKADTSLLNHLSGQPQHWW